MFFNNNSDHLELGLSDTKLTRKMGFRLAIGTSTVLTPNQQQVNNQQPTTINNNKEYIRKKDEDP